MTLVALLSVPVCVVAQAPPQAVEMVVTAALVDGDMQVRPVPLHGLRLISSEGNTLLLRTGADGKAALKVPRGGYRLESVAPIMFQGQTYAWAVVVQVDGTTAAVALSNDNATATQVAAAVPADARLDPAAGLFNRFSRSVFRVEAGLAHGTGFLADTLGGVVITNAHVIESADQGRLALALDVETRVRAKVLAVDSDADIAVLQIHPSLVEGRTKMALQQPVGRTAVVPGERLLAMGYPLSQDLTITAGIASSIRAGAVISDVNINPGNSGGPLMNADGEVIAVNTFGDGARSAGPGVSGSILIARAGPALARAATRLAEGDMPKADALPSLPTEALNVATLKAYADTADPRRYRAMSDIGVGGFEMTVQTPAQTFVAMHLFENDMAKDRKKREALNDVPDSERYSQVREYRDWAEYVGHPALPVVSFSVRPRLGETGGSVFRRLMIGANTQATYRFQGDVRGVMVFRDHEPAEPIKGGHVPMSVYEENRWVSLKDVADQGFYTFDAELLRPAGDGTPPSIIVAIYDLKNPKRWKCRELSSELIANAWNDFGIFYEQLRPAAGFIRADHKLVKGRKTGWRNSFLKDECDWS